MNKSLSIIDRGISDSKAEYKCVDERYGHRFVPVKGVAKGNNYGPQMMGIMKFIEVEVETKTLINGRVVKTKKKSKRSHMKVYCYKCLLMVKMELTSEVEEQD